MHNLPSSEVLAGRWSATKSAPRGAGANPGRKQLWGGGLFVSNSAASQRTRELQSFTAKAKKRGWGGEGEGGRETSTGKGKKRREPEKEAFCSWEEGVRGRSEGLLPKRFFPLTPHPGYSLPPGHRAKHRPWAAPRPGPGPLCSPQTRRRAPRPRRNHRVPIGRRPPRPAPPAPARPPAAPGAAARLPLPIFRAHTLQGAERSEQAWQRPAPARGLG